jgi:hypothetical protein
LDLFVRDFGQQKNGFEKQNKWFGKGNKWFGKGEKWFGKLNYFREGSGRRPGGLRFVLSQVRKSGRGAPRNSVLLVK